MTRASKNPFYLASLIFIAYVTITAILTAGGRLKLGMDQATASRYTTPVLLAWAMLILLLISRLKINRNNYLFLSFLATIIYICLAIPQLDAFVNRHAYIATTNQKNMAGLALQLNIYDEDLLKQIYPWPQALNHMASGAKANQISLFSNRKSPERHLLTNASSLHLKQCQAYITSIAPLKAKPSIYRVTGNATLVDNYINKDRLFFVNTNGVIIGVANITKKHIHHRFKPNRRINSTHFEGYIFDEPSSTTIQC